MKISCTASQQAAMESFFQENCCNHFGMEDCGTAAASCKDCLLKRLEWEIIKAPITITPFEKELCKELFAAGYRYIARDKDNKILAFHTEPQRFKHRDNWCSLREAFKLLYHQFKFITWADESPWSIEDILKLQVREVK